MSNDEVDDLLTDLGEGAQVESVGTFTLSAEKLRQKLAQFQFERPAQWILKIVQGLVAGGASKISIRQSRERIQVAFFCAVEPWSQLELEEQFLKPRPQVGLALSHLLKALYYLSFRFEARWALCPPNSVVALEWSGTELAQTSCESQVEHRLVIYLDGFGRKGDWLSSLGLNSFGAGPMWAAEVSGELCRYAYTCPVPLFLDGLRIDTLFLSPTLTQPRKFSGIYHGPISETVHAVSVGWGEPSEFGLKLPMATFKRARLDRFAQTRVPEFDYSKVSWMTLLTAHMKGPAELTGFVYHPWANPSLVTWVRYGVVVGQSQLATSCALSCQIFLSADEFSVDLSGLKLQSTDQSAKFTSSILRLVHQWLKKQTVELELLKSRDEGFLKVLQGGLLAGASSLMMCGALIEGLFVGAMVLPLGLLGSRGQPSLQLERDLRLELTQLCEKWPTKG